MWNRTVVAPCVALLLSGCAGYAIDYTRSRPSIIAPQLSRYGLDQGQSACVINGLGALSVWQLRQLEIAARSVTRGFGHPNRLTVPDLLWASRHVRDRDPRVAQTLRSAAEACQLDMTDLSTPRPIEPVAATTADIPAPPAPTWFNLGAAPTGQSISWQTASVERTASHRQAWFRVTNPGEQQPSADAYLLRVDCTARTINPMSARRLLPDGGIAAERDYGPAGEGALPVETGTVMEIAYVALCA